MQHLFPFSEAQKRIWFLEQIYPESPLNVIGGCVRIKGNICFNRLKNAFWSFIQAHPGMRLRLSQHSPIPFQYLHEWIPKPFPILDFSCFEDGEKIFNQWVEEQGSSPFHLHDHDLFEIKFFKISDADCGYLAKFHHIIADMWSIALVSSQIKELYESNSSQNPLSCPSFLEFLPLEQKYLSSDRFKKDRSFWHQELSFLSKDRDFQDSSHPKSKLMSFYLNEGLAEKVNDYRQKKQISLSVFFTALMSLYFYFHRKEDLVMGLPLSSRKTSQEKHCFGMFVSTLPFHSTVNSSLSFEMFCHETKRKITQAYFHYRYPFNMLVQELYHEGIDLKSSIKASVNYYQQNQPGTFDDFTVSYEEFFNGYQIYPLHLIIHEWDQSKIRLQIQYQINSYGSNEIDLFALSIQEYIRKMLESPDMPLKDLNLSSKITVSYKDKPYCNPEINHSITKTVIDIIHEQASLNPFQIAVEDAGKKLTYYELLLKIDQLAYTLQADIKTNQAVGIMGEASIECLVAILAIQKLGAFYVPIESSSSEQQIQHIVNDASINTLLFWKEIPSVLTLKTINVKDILSVNLTHTPISSKASLNGLAYVIYTSGTTGKPKGVKITHKNLISYLNWAKIYIDHKNSIFAFYSSICFDLTVTSIFLPLTMAGKIKIYRSEREYALNSIVLDPEVTILKATPSHLAIISDIPSLNSSLKCLIIGGEDLKVDLAFRLQNKFGESLKIYNEYGPTETTVGCMLYRFDINKDLEGSVPIGYAADTVQLLIFSDKGQLASSGEIGELYVSGAQVAEGYLNLNEETSKRFTFLPGYSFPFYKTGDLVSENSHGLLVFKGRKDDQVKVNGYRIELSEIESILKLHPYIEQACVLPYQLNAQTLLCAFLVSTHKVDVYELKNNLKKSLSQYKIPSHYVFVKKIPLTLNGKIDKSYLLSKLTPYIMLDDAEESVEQSTLNCFKKILDLSEIDLDANYFRLGGDSISAIQISSSLASQNISLLVKDILSSKSIKEAIACAKSTTLADYEGPSKGIQPLTPILKWFFQQNYQYPQFYHHSILLELKALFHLDHLRTALASIIKQHDVFRLNKYQNDNLYYNELLNSENLFINSYDLRENSSESAQTFIANIAEELKLQTQLENGLLASAAIFFTPKKEQFLLICIHHLAIDGLSWHILLHDLDIALNAISERRLLKIPPSPVSFQKWTQYLEQDSTYSQVPQEINKLFSQYPLNMVSTISESTENHEIKFALSNELSNRLIHLYSHSEIHPEEVITLTFLMSISHLSNENRIWLTLEHHGREFENSKLDLSRTIGWFTVMCPFHFSLSDDLSTNFKNIRKTLTLFRKYAQNLAWKNPFIDRIFSPYRFNYIGVLDRNYTQFILRDTGIGLDSHKENKKPLVDLNSYFLHNRLVNILSISSKLSFSADEFIQTFQSVMEFVLSNLAVLENSTIFETTFAIDLNEEDLEEIIKK